MEENDRKSFLSELIKKVQGLREEEKLIDQELQETRVREA